MKEIITFESIDVENPIVLPISYNHMIQAMIYRHLDNSVSEFLHEEGFKKGKRSYKLFTFSRMLGNYRLDKKTSTIRFGGPVKLVISSSFSDFSDSIGNSILTNKIIRLGKNQLEAKELLVRKEIVKGDEILIETMSPITAYSTLLRKDGKKFTYYYNPKEKEFSEIVSNNLKNKYSAFYSKKPPSEDVEVRAMGHTKESIINYKEFIIKGYLGKFRLRGPKTLLQMGVDAGLGAKSSQGLGCVKIMEKRIHC